MVSNKRQSVDILNLFEDKPYLKICAPMVRYSKLQFRSLVRNYGCDICYTPMILADSFCQSEKARNNEFTTNTSDLPLIAQFAANTVHDFVGAADLISPFCDGVGLNCGCPQRWAKQQGLGCIMLENPELISSIVKECRNRIPKPFTVSVKMRILKDLKKSVEICQQLEKAGVSFISVHARTSSQLAGDINEEALKLIAENVNCPVVGNGGVKSLEECDQLYQRTKCKGIMVANGILNNPTLFTGTNDTTIDCVQNWLNICYNSTINESEYKAIKEIGSKVAFNEKPANLTFQCFHHHLVFMLEKMLPKWKRRIFNNLQKFGDVLDFLEDELHVSPELYDYERFSRNRNISVCYEGRDCTYLDLKEKYNAGNRQRVVDSYSDATQGSYFSSRLNDVNSDDECDLNYMFIEGG